MQGTMSRVAKMFVIVSVVLILDHAITICASRPPPVFTTQHPNVYVFETDENGNQQNLILPCPINTPSSTLEYTWFRGNQELPRSMVNGEGSLIVSNITEGEYASREGVDYYCIARDNIGFNVAVRSRTITVYYAYFDGFERMAKPGESTVEVSVPVALNSDVALECDVLGVNPPPQIKWYNDTGVIQEVRQGNNVRFLDGGHYLYMRSLQAPHLKQQYYCTITNANLIQEISAPTRYLLTDNLTQGELMDYKQIGNQLAFVGNASFEFAYIGGTFGNNNRNGTRNNLFVNGLQVAALGNVGKINNITSSLLSSSGIVQLEAFVRYNGLSSDAIRSGTVTIHQVPRVTNTIQDKREYLVGEGSLTYTCQFEGAPLPNVTFYFNGAIISNASRGMTIIGNTLIIPSPQVSHSGLYQCIVSNEFSDDQQAWLLEIRQPISPKLQPLNLTELGGLEDQDFDILIVKNSNSTVSFFVDIEAYPCPNVVWSLNGTALGVSNNTFTYNNPCIGASQRSLNIWTFTLNVILISDTSGQYMANFTNVIGATSLPRTYITIPRPASIMSLNLSEACLKEGGNVSLRCYVNGFPRPSIQFLHNGNLIIPGEGEFKNFVQEYFELEIADITVKDGGRYSCSIPELLVPQQVTQQFDYCTVPRIIGLSSTSDPQIGKSFTIECMFNGTPLPDVIWRKGQDVINTGVDGYEIVAIPAKNSSRLEVSKPTSEFNGVYECIIKNGAGSDNEFVKIELTAATSLSREVILGISIGVVLCIVVILLAVITILACFYKDIKKKFRLWRNISLHPGILKHSKEYEERQNAKAST